MNSDNFRFEFLQDDLVVLDASAGVVHRITGETVDQVRNESDPVARRALIRSALVLGAAVGVSTLVLPSAAAASSGGGDGGWTGGAGDSEGPSVVTGLVADPWANSVTLSWTDDYVASHRVFQRVAGTGSYVQVWEGGGTSATITALDNSTTYQFIVVAVDGAGLVSAPSSPITATPLNLGDGWEPPANVGATAGTDMSGAASISVSWTRPLTTQTPFRYILEYRKTTTIAWSRYTETGDLGVSIQEQYRRGGTEAISAGSSYYVRVQAEYWDAINEVTQASTWVVAGPVAL